MNDWTIQLLGLIILIVIELYYLFGSYLHKRENLITKNRFRLFAVRDRFVYLVASSKLEEDQIVYRFFVSFINVLISETHIINLRLFLKVFGRITEKKLEKEQNVLNKALEEASQKGNKEIVDAILDFWKSLLEILVDNSPPLRAVLWLRGWIKKISFLQEDQQQKIKPYITHSVKSYSLYEKINFLKNRSENLVAC